MEGFFFINRPFTLFGKNSIFDFWVGSKYASVDDSYQRLYEWRIIIVKTPYDFLSGLVDSSLSFYQPSFKEILQYCFLCKLFKFIIILSDGVKKLLNLFNVLVHIQLTWLKQPTQRYRCSWFCFEIIQYLGVFEIKGFTKNLWLFCIICGTLNNHFSNNTGYMILWC